MTSALPFHPVVGRLSPRKVRIEGPNGRVLVVDDNEHGARATGARLDADGFDVKVALGGVQALEILGEWMPHIVLLDINMPEVRRIRGGFNDPKDWRDKSPRHHRHDGFRRKRTAFAWITVSVRRLLSAWRARRPFDSPHRGHADQLVLSFPISGNPSFITRRPSRTAHAWMTVCKSDNRSRCFQFPNRCGVFLRRRMMVCREV